MKSILALFLALITAAWGWSLFFTGGEPAFAAWTVRQEPLHLTGLWSIGLLSLAMVLATRPAWLETPLGGLDRIYRLHKWAGILAVAAGALHWLVEMSDDLVKAVFGREGRPSAEHATGLLEALRDLAEDLGEPAIYALLAMVAITLWKRFPFRPWRHLHRLMPVLYLALAMHAVLLAPGAYWSGPAGALLAMLVAAGSAASFASLAGRIGRRRQADGVVEAVRTPSADVTEVACRLGKSWRGHRPGQFAFVTFDATEGAHPFTIASADRCDRRVVFQIKALGDYTRGLAKRLHAGQPVRVEGPYGRFDFRRRAGRDEQIWIAGGVGVTPFLAWLESLQARPSEAPAAELYYCIRCREGDPFVTRLESLCAQLPAIRLHVRASDRDGPLTAQALQERHGGRKTLEIWFCGPRGLANALRTGLRRLGRGRVRFHQEAFEMR